MTRQPSDHPADVLARLVEEAKTSPVTVEDVRAWRTAAGEFVEPIDQSAAALKSLVDLLKMHATSTDETEPQQRVLEVVGPMQLLATVLDSMGGPPEVGRAAGFAALRFYQARVAVLEEALALDRSALAFVGALKSSPVAWRLEVAARLAAALVLEVSAPVPLSLLVLARQALSDAESTLHSTAAADCFEGADISGLTRRAVAAEARLAAFALEHLVDQVANVDPLLLPEPRRWGPYPGLCQKLELEELLAAFVSFARSRGRFDWCEPGEVVEHASACGHQWITRATFMDAIPRPEDGVKHGLLDVMSDAEPSPHRRYRLSIHGLRLVMRHVASLAPIANSHLPRSLVFHNPTDQPVELDFDLDDRGELSGDALEHLTVVIPAANKRDDS